VTFVTFNFKAVKQEFINHKQWIIL